MILNNILHFIYALFLFFMNAFITLGFVAIVVSVYRLFNKLKRGENE